MSSPLRVSEAAAASARASAGDTVEGALLMAYRALELGNSRESRELAQSVLIAARSSGNSYLQGAALTCLAHSDRVGSRLRRAVDTARRAAQIFESLGDLEGEASALTTLSQSCILLGRTDEAYESALLCLRLSEMHGDSKQLVIAYNTLGVVNCWAGNFERANEYLELAVEIGASCTPLVSQFQPQLNQCWVEASRIVDERYRTGRLGNLDRMAHAIAKLNQLEQTGDTSSLMVGLDPMSRTISLVMTALLSGWERRPDAAKLQVDLATGSLLGTVTWLDALVRWGAAELAWAQGDLATAHEALSDMKSIALASEYEQFACTAQQLLIQVLEEQGNHEQVRFEHRELRVRERRLVAESLAGRMAVVDWRLQARRSERNLQQALIESKQFERWSLEDPLTMLPNRRCAEHALQERLRAAEAKGRPLTVAMLDVDKFKSINDVFTHTVGDRVLKELGAIMTAQVRQQDLPARWAGDEFVILFGDADEETARRACERIHGAIAATDWESIASGLHVTVSIGLSEARDGDSIDNILERSDVSMYESKSMGLESAGS